METHSFYATIGINIEFNDEDFEFIKLSMKHHYDFTVKSSVEVGGFWYGFENLRKWGKEYPIDGDNPNIGKFEERQMQLILKSIEFSDNPLSYKITKRLYGIVNEMGVKWKEINKQLNPLPHDQH